MAIPEKYKRTFTKAEINQLPLRHYQGPVELVSSPEGLALAVDRLGRERLLGFDTETRPSFKKGVNHPPSLIQLAGSQTVYLFQVDQLPPANGLQSILADPAIIKTGVAVRDDIKDLKRIWPFEESGFIDLGELARRLDLKTHGLRNLAANFLGFRISKHAQVSNWSREELTPKQIIYAATDAWVSREIHLAMAGLGLLENPED